MNEKFWADKRTLITGGAGFLGHHVVPKLHARGAQITVPRSREYDLRNDGDVKKLFRDCEPEVVIHMAVNGGGIGYQRMHPGSIFYDTIMMNTLVLEESRVHDVEKFVGIGTVCSYPKFTPVPFNEDDLWIGYPEETNAPYGLAKKMMLVQTESYRQEYGFNSIHLLLVNMYGPHDDFNIKTSHVIPALIKRMLNAVKNDIKEIVVWGTGNPSREFLYVDDAAEGIILAAERYGKPDPVNLGTGLDITIKDLADMIAELTGYNGSIVWDTTKPDGQPKRCLDVSRAKEMFGFEARTNFEEGLKKTIDWYNINKDKIQ